MQRQDARPTDGRRALGTAARWLAVGLAWGLQAALAGGRGGNQRSITGGA